MPPWPAWAVARQLSDGVADRVSPQPKYDLRPILDCVQNHVEPMRKQLLWGFDLPYMLTGLLNQHPRAAIRFNALAKKGDILEFYDSVTQEE